MRCSLSPFGVYCVFALGFLTGALMFGERLPSFGAAVFHAATIVACIWTVRKDGLQDRTGKWQRMSNQFWWRRAPDDTAE